MADCAALEMLCPGNRTGGSNPPLSVSFSAALRDCVRVAVLLWGRCDSHSQSAQLLSARNPALPGLKLSRVALLW